MLATFKLIKDFIQYQQQKDHYNSTMEVKQKQPFQEPQIKKYYKKSLCRFYLRGLCILQPKDCQYSHGIEDLDYQPWNGEDVQYDYLKQTDFTQKKAVKGPRIYKNLYDFQQQKKYTLQEINDEGPKRKEVRNKMHQRQYQLFINVLEKYYPGAQFSQHFLVRQYTRVGFNKLMTKINFTFLVSFLCEAPDSKYFKHSLIMPPYTKKQRSFIIKKAPLQQTHNFYKNIYEKHRKQAQGPLDEALIKKTLFSAHRPSLHIPPLNLHLKYYKKPFPYFLKQIAGENNQVQIIFEADSETLVKSSIDYLNANKDKIVSWNDVFMHLSKLHKINNGNTVNQIKPLLVEQGYLFLYFPSVNFIIHKQHQKNFQFKDQAIVTENFSVCPCKFRQKYPQEAFLGILKNKQTILPEKQSLDIYNWQSMIMCAPAILNSKILGVDLEGRLRKNGYVEMIQLNNGRNTFLIDIFQMDLNGDCDTFQMVKKIVRNVMVDHNILKIFHDSRHDSLALHQFINTCVVNAFDTSAIETYINQLQLYQSKIKAKDILTKVVNVKTPGLNEVLAKYNAPHGINKNKDLFHGMWKKGITNIFDKRPLDPQYRDYCIRDVLDLPYVNAIMSETLNQSLTSWISAQYIKYGYLSTEEGQQAKN